MFTARDTEKTETCCHTHTPAYVPTGGNRCVTLAELESEIICCVLLPFFPCLLVTENRLVLVKLARAVKNRALTQSLCN